MEDGASGLFDLPAGWRDVLGPELTQPYFHDLAAFVSNERRTHKVFPPDEDVYNALRHTPYDRVRVLLLGQDPYHDIGQAHGLCFSVRPGCKPPPSLVNIFKELKSDTGIQTPASGCLTRWAEQGVLMLNAVLTVRAHEPGSHAGRGWERFTDAVIRRLNQREDSVVFVLWGGYARKKRPLIDGSRHTIVESAHPSPLSARNGFFGSRPFSKINAALRAAGKPEIDWRL
jgi:uracil-DNA glycosylase